ncbi:nitric-oxide synthase [Paenibacillus sp. RU4T]|nr:nitric-oxide synthase [Paenibacillus sp. RU4X]SIQ51779.1 nitric-oxide synthase [Paenibacillus sp. RU4T]
MSSMEGMDTVCREAESFLRRYFGERDKPPAEAEERIREVLSAIRRTGGYDHTAEELVYGGKAAWRNNSRCIGRLFWNSLEVIDARHASTEDEVAECLFRHLEKAGAEGRIRPLMTVFRSRSEGSEEISIWNHQLIRYAGYPSPDGSSPRRGDPASDEFTSICLSLGWKGSGGDFDVLPLVIGIGAREPKLYEIPPHLVQEVEIRHPETSALDSLGLRWYAVPVISDMSLEIGGIQYPAAPFNGWYMETEIGARNFADAGRYDRLPDVADALGLDRSSNTTLWKDRALVELNLAVLHSFKRDGVSIVDHHTAADQFMRFQQQEREQGRDVSARWSWLIPPISPAATAVWHDSAMQEYDLSPSLSYQPPAWVRAGTSAARPAPPESSGAAQPPLYAEAAGGRSGCPFHVSGGS